MSNRNPAVLSILVGCVILAAVTSTSARSAGQVTGNVVDADGKPVIDVTIRFTSQDGKGNPQEITTKKKGRFFKRGLPEGAYRLELVDSELFIRRIEYRLRRPDGLLVGQGELDGHPSKGVENVPLSGQNEVKLKLFLAAKGSEAARERELAVAYPALNSAANLYNSGKFAEAAAEAKRIIADTPDLGDAYYVHGVALEKLERYAESESALLEATQRIPDYPRIWNALGEVTMNLAAGLETAGDADKAREAFGRAAKALTEALKREPDSMPSRLNLSVALDRTDNDERLTPLLEEILAEDPAHLQSRLKLASLYSQQGRHEGAVALLQEIPATEKRAAVTIYNVAVRMNDDGDVDGSLIAAQRAAEIDPELSHARRLIAQILLGKNDPPAAIEAIRVFLELAPEDPEAETYRRILTQLEGQQ